MTYQVLARKWRPKDFASLVGQEHVVRALTHALDGGRLHHAYLFTGTRGVGKTTLSRIFAKALNCETGVSSTPCGVCRACREIDEGRFVDYVEMDAASNRGVDEMAALLERAVYAPVDARFKVYMIDEVHMLTNHAFNAMLKTLEEPPPHVKFILATTDPQKIPVTVLSRCLQFNLKQMPAGHIVGHLERILGEEGVPFDAQALRLLARAAEGSMRDALSLTDQAIAYSANQVSEDAVRGMLGALDQSYLIRLLDALVDGDGAAVLSVADEMALRSLSFPTALQDLASLLHRIGWAQFAPASVLDEWPEAQDIRRFAQALSPEQVQLFYQIATIGRAELGLAPDEYAGFTMALLRMLAFEPAPGGAAGGPNGAAAGGLATGATGAAGRRGSAAAVTAAGAASAAQMPSAAPAGSRPSSQAGESVAAAVAPAERRNLPPVPEQAPSRAEQGSAAAGQTSPAAARSLPDNPAADIAPAAPVPAPQTHRDAASAADVPPVAEAAGEPADVVDDPGTREAAIASSGPGESDASAAHAGQRVVSDAVPGGAPSVPASEALSPVPQMAPMTADSTGAVSSAATPDVLAETATPSLTSTVAPSRLSSAVDALPAASAAPGSMTEALADAAPRRGGASAALDVLRNAGMKLSTERGRTAASAPAAPKPATPRASAATPAPAPAARRAQDVEPAREIRESREVRDGRDGRDPAGSAGASAVPPWEEIPPDDYVPLSSEDDYFGALPDDGYVPAFDRGPDDVRVAAPAPMPADTRPLPPAIALDAIGFAGEWPALAADLPLKGIAYQLAFNSELTALDGHTLKLSVPVPQYAEASQVAKLKAALAERIGRALDVQVDVGPARRTAAALDAIARAQRQQEAEREIGADPFVQSLIREFGARIVPGSVKPIAPDAGGNAPSTH